MTGLLDEANRSVWLEPQNESVVRLLRERLENDDAVELVLQPGDVTRYELLLTPCAIGRTAKVSDDGREPEVEPGMGQWLYVEVLNVGFADRPARFIHTVEATWQDVQERMGCRNPYTAAAIAGTINALWYEAPAT